MKGTLIRLILFAVFFLVARYVIGWPLELSLLAGFIATYITEPLISQKLQ